MLDTNKINMLALSKGLNGLLLLGTTALFATNLVLGGLLWQVVGNKSRTLVPPTISQAFTVSDGAVDSAYLQQMAEYFVFLKLNITPKSVERNYGRLLDYVSSETWPSVQPALVADALNVIDENVSSRFDVDSVRVAEDSLQVKLTGTLQKHVGSRPIPPESVSYVVDMSYEHGELALLTIKKIKEHI